MVKGDFFLGMEIASRYSVFVRRMATIIGVLALLSLPTVASAALTVTVHGPSRPQSAPPGSQRVEMLSVDIANDAAHEVDVHSLTVLHRGLGERSDILGVYAMDEQNERLSDRFAFQSGDGTAQIRFRPLLTIPGRGSVTIFILADIAADAAIAGEHRLWLSSPSDIDAGDETVAVRQGSVVAQTRTAGAGRPTIAIEYPKLNERVRFGEQQLVGRIRLTAGAGDDQTIATITLTNAGKARGEDLKNIVLVSNSGKRLTDTAARLAGRNKDRVTLTFDPPFRLDAGSTVTLNVRADALASRRKTIQLLVEEPSDIRASPEKASRQR